MEMVKQNDKNIANRNLKTQMGTETYLAMKNSMNNDLEMKVQKKYVVRKNEV
jgi:hypothetical protein